MLQLTETTLFHWDLALEFLYTRLHDTKKNFSGPRSDMRKVQQWVYKMQNPSQQTGGSSASAHSFASHLVDTDVVTSTGSQRSQQSLALNISSSDGLRYRHISDIAVDNTFGFNKDIFNAFSTPSSNQATKNFMGLPSSDELCLGDDNNVDMCAPQPHLNVKDYNSDVDKGPHTGREALGLGWRELSVGSDSDSRIIEVSPVSQGEEQPSVKTEDCMVELSASFIKSDSVKKATNKDLPSSAQPAYQHEVVPSIWHWAAGNAPDPFNIDGSEMVSALKAIWNCVYSNDVVFDPPTVVSLTNQQFSEWRNGFTSAATSALTSLFASDTDYQEHEARVALATDMVEHYHFLFSESVLDNHELWMGMWHGPLLLQVFASHFNAISSRVPIPELGSKSQGYNGAMALAAAAIERMLNLVANCEINIRFFIKDKESTGTKCKRRPSKAMVWKVVQLNGPPQPFSDFLWGGATRDFMSSLEQVPHDAMTRIVEEAKSVAACHKARAPKSTVHSACHSECATLAFR
ncbi:hypothetical protein EI94DRAFT_1817313 [Lactarius quietus]|nr:hypothetical protein EI94DRAFT_1817313 [Lactarius quietus]